MRQRDGRAANPINKLRSGKNGHPLFFFFFSIFIFIFNTYNENKINTEKWGKILKILFEYRLLQKFEYIEMKMKKKERKKKSKITTYERNISSLVQTQYP